MVLGSISAVGPDISKCVSWGRDRWGSRDVPAAANYSNMLWVLLIGVPILLYSASINGVDNKKLAVPHLQCRSSLQTHAVDRA